MEEMKYSVLMADDDEDDCTLAREAFSESGSLATFSCVEDGIDLLDCLHSQSDPLALPTLIILDLNMPRKDGRQVLREIKADPSLQNIPIVIFTTSRDQKDICFALKAGAELFITKPATYDEWVGIMKRLSDRWLN